MNLRTELTPAHSPFQLGIQDALLTLGSCFADSMGRRMADNKLAALVNPFGVIFHPLAAIRLLKHALQDTPLPESSYLSHEGCWRNYLLHSDHQHESREALEERLSELLQTTGHYLRTAHTLFLTWGTAFQYTLQEPSLPVANCHKQPQKLFSKTLTHPEEIVQEIKQFWQQLKSINPGLKLVITVSPVRHLKDTLPLNSVSKSILRYAAHQLSELLPDSYYFPAYELLLDDLRDYRFFADDLLHPSALAEEYIWQKFQQTLLTSESREMITQWSKLKQAIEHRPFQPGGPAYRKHLESTLQKLEQFPYPIDLSNEVKVVKGKLDLRREI